MLVIHQLDATRPRRRNGPATPQQPRNACDSSSIKMMHVQLGLVFLNSVCHVSMASLVRWQSWWPFLTDRPSNMCLDTQDANFPDGTHNTQLFRLCLHCAC
jgi:hypothetical protein